MSHWGSPEIVTQSTPATIDLALEEERAFVESLGGYTLEIAGARLVTHERIPVPRFNFIQDVRVSAARQAAFFERALDHYFQRALRPTVRVAEPVEEHLDRGLRSFGFRPRAEPHCLLLARAPGRPRGNGTFALRRPEPEEVDLVVGFWAPEKEREELRRAVEVSWTRPNPGETLVPILAEREGRAVAAALVHVHRGISAVHAVATQPTSRGQGAATALVEAALTEVVPSGTPVAMHADSRRLVGRLESLGFAVVESHRAYDLPPEAALALPPLGPPGPPRWRPPRRPRPPP